MGGNVPAPARAVEESGPPQPGADARRDAERLQGQRGQQDQQALTAPRPEAKLAQENAAPTTGPRQNNAKPSPVPAEPLARLATPPPPPPAQIPVPQAAPPPPPPAAPPPAATTAAARSSTVTGLPQSNLNIDITGIKPTDPTPGPVIAEFVVGTDLQAAEGAALADRFRASGAGRGGGGGGGRGAVAQKTTDGFASTEPVRWRLRGASPSPFAAMNSVERSNDAGVAWQPVALPALTTSLSVGSAPTNTVCWLAGRAGTVLLSTDGTTFRQVTKPVDADLVSVRATDARSATVRTADGRTFATADGGVTWTSRSDSPSQ
jgi:hypothetical protein